MLQKTTLILFLILNLSRFSNHFYFYWIELFILKEIQWKRKTKNKRKETIKTELERKKKELTLYYSTVLCIVSIFGCFRFGDVFDEQPDLRLSLTDDEESFISERNLSTWLSSCIAIVSIDVESSLIVIDGDVSLNDDFSDSLSVDCWTRPNELNNCFSLPDDISVCDSSGKTKVLFRKVGGEGVDFLVEDGGVWWESEFGLSRS